MRLSATVTDDSPVRFKSLPIQAVLTSDVKPVGLERFPERYFLLASPGGSGGITKSIVSVRRYLIKSAGHILSLLAPVNPKVARNDISKIGKVALGRGNISGR